MRQLVEFGEAARDNVDDQTAVPSGIFDRANQLKRRRRVRRLLSVSAGFVLVVAVGAALFVAGSGDDRVTTVETAESPVGGEGQDSGRCSTVLVGGVEREVCLRVPGTALWRVGGDDYVVSYGEVDPAGDPPVKIVVERLDEVQNLNRLGGSCLSSDVASAVELYVGLDPPLFRVGPCSPNYSFVSLLPAGPLPDQVLLFESDGSTWTYVATIPGGMDSPMVCEAAPSYEAPNGGLTARDICELSG